MRVRYQAFLAVLMLVAGACSGSSGLRADDATPPADALFKSALDGVDDLRALEEVVVRITAQVLPATVGVELGGVRASGVVVSADGDVLTASHVAGGPGRKVSVVFPDGQRVPAETLGLNPDVDGALVRITEQGPWPFAPIVPSDELPEPGHWCLGTGHPGSYQADRSPPVRLGRVIESNRYVIRTDCLIMPGDSGGPLFDLQGRVIGIHSRISESPTVNLHVPAITYLSTWERLRSGLVSRVSPRSLFLAQFDFNQDGAVSGTEIPEGPFREVFSRLSTQFALNQDRTYSIEELRELVGLKIAPDRDEDGRRGFAADNFLGGSAGHIEILENDSYTRGDLVLDAFREVVEPLRHSAVEIRRREGPRLAMGTVVDEGGLIVTKSSQLPRDSANSGPLTCRLSNGREVAAELMAEDERDDLALLRVQASGLTPVSLQGDPRPELGSWVISVGTGRRPASVGVVSVAARPILGAPGFLGVEGAEGDDGPVIVGIINGSAASRTTLLIGDIITHVGEKRVNTFREMGEELRRHRPGETVTINFLRDGQAMSVDSVLGRHPHYRSDNADSMSGRVSRRRDDFSSALQHDSVLDPSECGGPLFDLSGRLLGINIARVERTTTYALTLDRVAAVVERLRRQEAAHASEP